MAPTWVRQIFSVSVLLLPLFAGSAAAQELAKEQPKEAQAPPSPNETTTLPEMVVAEQPEQAYAVKQATTATKTDTPIMETPFSVKAIPQQVLQDQQVIRLEKALQNVSGVTKFATNQGGSDGFIIRGFGSNTLYRDGFFTPDVLGGGTATRDIANLERVEVLKGPGSILFGRTEPGGVINLVTKQPLLTPYYSLQQQFGSFSFFRTTVDATGPIPGHEALLYRVNLAYEDAGSFRDFVHNDRFFLAPVLRWNIGPRTQATFEFEYQRFDEEPDPGIAPLGDRPAPLPRSRFLGEPQNGSSKGDRLLASFHWSHDFNENWTLRHRFTSEFWSYQSRSLFFNFPEDDGTLNRFFNNAGRTRSDRYGTSVDLTGKVGTGPIKHTFLFGFDYFRVDDMLFRLNCCQAAPAFNIFKPTYLKSPPVFDPTQNFGLDFTQSWYGLYFQDQFELPYNLYALAGFRYDNARGRNNELQLTTSDDDRLSPRGGLLWRPLQWLSMYGSYTENFGASNSFFRNDGKLFPPQTAQQWELGAKTEFWDGKFNATFAYFELTKQNIEAGDPLNPGNSLLIGEAESHGVEFDIAGELLPGWQVIGAYAYTPFAKVTKGNETSFPAVGHRFHNAPRHSGSFFSTYEVRQGSLKGLKLGGGVVGASQREGDAFGPPDYQMPGYTTVNLLASYQWELGPTKLTAQLNVDNLGDKTYFPGSNSGEFISVGAPRSFFGSLRVEY